MKVVIRAVLLVAIVGMGAYLLGFWSPSDALMGRWRWATPATTTTPGNAGAVRDRLGDLDERAVRAAHNADDYMSDASLSGKIKSKMTLDDVVRARTIGVSTTSGVVTLTGTVQTQAERDQALRLARNTTGVTLVVDRLAIVP